VLYEQVIGSISVAILVVQVINFVKNQTRLTNLRRLVLKIDIVGSPEVTGGILRLAYLLELAPDLEELVLHVSDLTLQLKILK
jgi:hypothetical protein